MVYLFTIAYLLLVMKAIYKAFYNIRHPSRSMSWILVIIFLPLIGIFLFHIAGRSVKKDKYFQVKKPFFNLTTHINNNHPEIQKSKGLIKLIDASDSSAVSYSNEVTVHLNGHEVFEKIKEDIQGATQSIHLDFYIIECGQLLNSLIEIFVQKIAAGVKIRLVYDGFGTRDEYSETFKKMKNAGVEIKEFMPYSWIKSFDHVNYRNHRKMIIIDSTIAYTGGMNISDKHIDGDPVLGIWRDTFVRIVGEGSSHMDMVFASDWYHAGGSKINIIPKATMGTSSTPVQIISSGPDSEDMGILHQYFMMITEAKEYIYLATPYFVPGESIITALKTKAMSGVDVELMMPYDSDSKWMRWLMFSYLEDLLKVGVKVWIYHEGFLHSKVIVSDDTICSIGSANVDERSFATNFELNAIIYDSTIAQEVAQQFTHDKQGCEQLHFESFIIRRDRNKFLEALARLASPLL